MIDSRFLNIGSGPHYMPGWVNVDLYADDADVKCTAFAMPFGPGSFDRVYMGHFLEHVPLFDVPRLIEEVRRVCAPRSRVVVVGPDYVKALRMNAPLWLLDQIKRHPTPDQPGSGHDWTPTAELTAIALDAGGLVEIEETEVSTIMRPDWPNTVSDRWQFALTARTPDA